MIGMVTAVECVYMASGMRNGIKRWMDTSWVDVIQRIILWPHLTNKLMWKHLGTGGAIKPLEKNLVIY